MDFVIAHGSGYITNEVKTAIFTVLYHARELRTSTSVTKLRPGAPRSLAERIMKYRSKVSFFFIEAVA